jgi:putative ABC transport system permease protein
LLRLSLKNLFARKWRTAMTAIAVVFGIALVSGTYVLTDTTNEAFDDIFVRSNERIDVTVTPKEQVRQFDGSVPAFPDRFLKKVRAVDGVEVAEGSVFATGSILNLENESTGAPFAPQFISSGLAPRLSSVEYVEGKRATGPGEAALDLEAAKRGGVEIGDRIKLVGAGPARPFEVVGLTQLGGASFGGTSIAQVTLSVAQELTDRRGRFDQISVGGDGSVSAEDLRDRIAEVLPKDLLVETGSENADRQASEIRDGLSFLSIALFAFAAISLLVGSFVIFNVFSITVAQRTREFGMLRTLGSSRRQILATVLAEGILIGLIASGLGLVAGIGLAEGLSALLSALGADLPGKSLIVAPRTIIASFIVGIGVTLVSSLIPAYRATRVPPIAALSEGVLQAGRIRLWVRALISAVMGTAGVALIAWVLIGDIDGGAGAARIGAGAVLLVVAISIFSPRLIQPMVRMIGVPVRAVGGLTGRLATENALRTPSRTAVTSAALMIGIALVSFVTIFASGLNSSVTDVIDQNLEGEIVLQGPGGFVPIPPEAARLAGRARGVEAVSGVRYGQVKVPGSGERPISSIEPKSVNDVLDVDWLDGSPRQLEELSRGRAVISQGLSQRADLKVGDRFRVLSQAGTRPKLEVTGVLASGNLDLLGDIVVDERSMVRDFGVTEDQFALVKVVPGSEVEQVKDRVANKLDRAGFPTVEVLNQEELKDRQKEQINAILALIYVLLALAVIVSLVGIVVTLILSIYERTRELGMVRAIGMSRRQVRRMVTYEAVITAVLGAVAGLILGVLFAFLMGIPLEGEGFVLSYPIGTLALILVLSALAGVLAAIYPARKAAKLDILEAIAYE